MKRTNIILEDEQHKQLKIRAQQQRKTLGSLVRAAIDAAYKERDLLEERRQVALSAYKEGFISLGKLAEVLGLDPVSTRKHLIEKGIHPLSLDQKELEQDIKNV